MKQMLNKVRYIYQQNLKNYLIGKGMFLVSNGDTYFGKLFSR